MTSALSHTEPAAALVSEALLTTPDYALSPSIVVKELSDREKVLKELSALCHAQDLVAAEFEEKLRNEWKVLNKGKGEGSAERRWEWLRGKVAEVNRMVVEWKKDIDKVFERAGREGLSKVKLLVLEEVEGR